MEIKVLGPGCAKCHALDKLVREVVQEQSLDAQVEYVQDMRRIVDYNILSTPGLVVDGKVVSSGRVPGKAELATMLQAAKT